MKTSGLGGALTQLCVAITILRAESLTLMLHTFSFQCYPSGGLYCVVYWVRAQCNPGSGYQSFGGIYFLPYKGESKSWYPPPRVQYAVKNEKITRRIFTSELHTLYAGIAIVVCSLAFHTWFFDKMNAYHGLDTLCEHWLRGSTPICSKFFQKVPFCSLECTQSWYGVPARRPSAFGVWWTWKELQNKQALKSSRPIERHAFSIPVCWKCIYRQRREKRRNCVRH
jgi:hypothetical protein